MSRQFDGPDRRVASRNVEPPVAANARAAQSPKAANLKAASSEQAFFRLDVMRSLQLHRRLALTIAAVGLALGIVYYFSMAPVYLAQCLVYVQPAPPSVIQQGNSNRWPYDTNTYESYIQQQIQNVMREDVLTSALKKLGDAGKKPNESQQDALDRLRKQLDVARVAQTYQFTIGARASNPQLAAQTANAVAASYIEGTAHDQRVGDRQRLTMLHEERDRVQSALNEDRAEQQELNKQLGVASVGVAPDHFDQDISELRTELVKARTDHDAAEARFAAMGANHGTSSSAIDAAADDSADKDAGLISMKTALNARKAILISKMANLTPGNPEYKQDAAELAQINTNLDQMMKELRTRAASSIQLQLRSELERTAGLEAHLNTQLRQLVSSATNATSKLQRASDLAADITRLQTRYSAVDEQLHNLMLEDAAPTGAYISTPADVPDRRAKSGRTRNAAIIVMAGVFFGMLAAVVRNKLDRHVYVASDIEGILGFGPMALLPDFAEVSEGAAEEHLLRLAAAIEHADKHGRLRSCVFTGASSGTGVTTIVTRVRSLLEAMGRPTVCVDASGTSAEEELAAAPAEGSAGTQALATSGARGLQSALAFQRSNEADDKAGKTLVLTDAAPIAVSAETEYLVRFADCAIVVVESGVTTRAEIRDTAAILQRLNVGAVGFVLNRVGLAKADPAFRASVDGIEKHLQSQLGAAPRRTRQTDAVVAVAPDVPATAAADAALSAPVLHVQTANAEPSTHQAASDLPSTPHPSTAHPSNLAPVTIAEPSAPEPSAPEPSWRVSPAHPSLPRTWDLASPSASFPAVERAASQVEVPATQIEAELGAYLFSDRPVASFEPLNRQLEPSSRQFEPLSRQLDPLTQQLEPSYRQLDPLTQQLEPLSRQQPPSINLSQDPPLAAHAAPALSKFETPPLDAVGPQSNLEAAPAPSGPLAASTQIEQQKQAVEWDLQSAETPTAPPLVPAVHQPAPVVHQSLWAQRELLPAPAPPESQRGNELPTVALPALSSEEPLPEGDPDIPWWLSDIPVQRVEPPPPLLWQGEIPGKSRKDASHLAPAPAEIAQHGDPSRNKRAGSPAQQSLGERAAGLHGFPPPQFARGPADLAVQDNAPQRLTSRLSGLRNLLTGLGLKEAHASAANSDAEDTPLDRGNVAAANSNPGSFAARQGNQPAVPGTREVSAQPEILKPSANRADFKSGDSSSPEKSLVRTFPSGADREEPTLPSRRGQYRNL